MTNQHPLIEAVREATAILKEHRYYSIEHSDKEEFLEELTELARELGYHLGRQGIRWPDLAAAAEDRWAKLIGSVNGEVGVEYPLTKAIQNAVIGLTTRRGQAG